MLLHATILLERMFMNYDNWLQEEWDDAGKFSILEKEMKVDLQNQIEKNGMKILSNPYRPFAVCAVVENEAGDKWLCITTDDVRGGAEWFERVSLRRMSSPKDWKGKTLHFCRWDELAEKAQQYFGAEYDGEIL